MTGRDPMKGRHAVGGKTGSAGKMRKGQGEPASNKFTTAATAQKSMKPPFIPDAKETSADEMRMISEPPAPFKNRQTAAQMPAGTGPKGAVPGQEPKNVYAGKSGSSVGQSNPPGGPVGQGKMPNQSGQIGGRMGYPPPARKAGFNVSGFKSSRAARFYGE